MTQTETEPHGQTPAQGRAADSSRQTVTGGGPPSGMCVCKCTIMFSMVIPIFHYWKVFTMGSSIFQCVSKTNEILVIHLVFITCLNLGYAQRYCLS